MGSVRKFLYRSNLPEREEHHARLFVDLAENIHIHHREFRTVFSLDEYFEYVDIITKSTTDVRNFLEQNKEYKEGEFPTTIMVAGGRERQLKFLENSPKPNQSRYFPNDFGIELQDEFVTDEIHFHYRDFRIAMDRIRFKEIAKGFKAALDSLNEFERDESYIRKSHSDRIIRDFNNHENIDDNSHMGVKKVLLDDINSYWHDDTEKKWKPDKEAIELLIVKYKELGYWAPIILSTESDGTHFIVNGHHRYYAAKKINNISIDSIILDIPFDNTENIRNAEVSLKLFDIETNYKYDLTSFLNSFLGFKFNRHYSGVYHKKMMRLTWWFRMLRKVKHSLLGKDYVFRTFNENHNKSS